ncbi:MAG: branched-chain amino acid ABC transporter substrate-binding protein [Methyloceanibacter sp.]|nr:branched-chain amino acid ABC transporter substrate-binding protein [Methyloceanibacter sp.]
MAAEEPPAPAAAPAGTPPTAEAPATASPSAATPAAKKQPDGGFSVEVPQSPPPRNPLPIGYIRELVERPRPASRVDAEPSDAGVSGAKMANDENNAGGQFTGELYSLDVSTVASADKAVEALQKFYDSGHHFIIVDASADTLLKLSDFAKGKDILLFNIRATDVSLRQEDCRANIMHVAPDRFMLADALAQYLVLKKWTNWLMVHGSTPGDLAYADAIKRAAARFGATIVDDREYQDVSGGRRDDVGTIPPGKQASSDAAFAAGGDYQIIIVADEDQLFGPYMPYRGGADARPVAGTTGLTATTWSPGHEKWGATQANNHFEKDFKRLMLPIDYQAYVAARTIGEAVTRNDGADFATIAAFIHGPELQLAPFKGIKQQYRPWDGQFRQPILIATDKVPVSVSPQRGFPHASHADIDVDTLGIDEPESRCKM